MKTGVIYTGIAKILARMIFHKPKLIFEEPVPEGEPVIFTANHSGAFGPVNAALYFPACRPWTIAQILQKDSAADFIFYDFFAGAVKKHKFFWHLLSHIVAFLLRPLLLNVDGIPVYHDRRVTQTLNDSLEALKNGDNLVIFPECPEKFTEHINDFYSGFAKLGALYYKETGKKLKFYPTYIAHPLKKILIGKPIEFNPDNPSVQRKQISEYLRNKTEELANTLPPHSVQPFLTEEWYKAYGHYWTENRMLEYWQLSEKNIKSKKSKNSKRKEKNQL